MSSQFYDNALRETYRFPAVAIDTGAIFGRVIGPAGKQGRVVNISGLVTAELTSGPTDITVDTVAGLTILPTMAIPALVADLGFAAPQRGVGGLNLADDLPADTVLEFASVGTAAAGDGDVTITIDWF